MPLFAASLPQSDGAIGREERRVSLAAARLIYRYADGIDGLKMPMAQAQGPLAQLALHPRWVAGQAANLASLEKDLLDFALGFDEDKGFETLADYARLFTSKPVPAVASYWTDDDAFCDQRVAGLNPMILRRITEDGTVGLGWSRLAPRLASATDDSVLHAALGPDATWSSAVAAGQLFVTDYKALATIVADPDAVGDDAGKRVLAPIGVFARRADEDHLRPVLIQLGQTPDSPVHTPGVAPDWLMAKTYLQTADLNYNQLINHLGLVHLIQDAMAIAMHRQLDSRHPLFRLLQKHFAAMLIINFGGELVLVGSTGIVAKILEEGGEGSADLINEAYERWSFDDLDFEAGLRDRGLWQPEVLPYFPYRDDGKRLWDTLGDYVTRYLEFYYGPVGTERANAAVREDWELQAWLNELSAEGTGDGGGLGKVAGLPASIDDLQTLATIVHRIVWTAGPQHAAVNFPQVDFASYVPNLPGANYRAPIEGPVSQSDLLAMMPPVKQAKTQWQTTYELAGYHYDRLLDYADDMDEAIRPLVSSTFDTLQGPVTQAIEAANQAREQAGRLTYRWLLPDNVPNSTSV